MSADSLFTSSPPLACEPQTVQEIAHALAHCKLTGVPLGMLERGAIMVALDQHAGNRSHAARALGISVRTLQRKLKQWGV